METVLPPLEIKKSSAHIVRGLESPEEIMSFLETVGRICYQSGTSIDQNTADKFVRMLVRLGHESVLEHVTVTVRVECDRAMAQQWTRHRLAAYTMESQRYVKYDQGISVIDPEFMVDGKVYDWETLDVREAPKGLCSAYNTFYNACDSARMSYIEMRMGGKTRPEDARSVLPNAARTVFYTSTNLRGWRHFFNMRCATGAQHTIRRVARELLKEFNQKLPAIFYDLIEKYN